MNFRFWMAAASLLAIVALAAGCQAAPTTTPTRAPSPTAANPAPTAPQGGTVANRYSAPPPMTIDQNKTYQAVLHTTMGDITIDFFPKEAPKTVNNFVFLARDGFYSSTAT